MSFSRVALQVLFMTLFLFAGRTSFGKEVKYKDYQLDLTGVERVFVVGLKGSLKITLAGKSGGGVLKARKSIADKLAGDSFDSWSYSVRREDKLLRVEVLGGDTAERLVTELEAGRVPEMHLELELPPLPVEVAWREGQVIAQRWKAPLAVEVLDGGVRLTDSEGDVRIVARRGEVRVERHKGRLEADLQAAKFVAVQVEGDVALESFAAESQLSNLKGSIRLRTVGGSVMVQKLVGQVEFESARGTVNLQEIDGRVRGESEEGSVSAQVEGDPDIQVETGSAPVSLKLPAGSGAWVRLQSAEGQIVVPDTLNVTRTETMKSAAGRLGAVGKGSVVVKSKSGTLRVR